MKLSLIPALVVLVSCVSTPSDKFSYQARQYGFTETHIKTDNFDLAIYANQASENLDNTNLHVYLSGDGAPFLRSHYVSADPTPTNGITLELMSLDPNPSILVGRPCYHHVINSQACQGEKYWTTHRYSEDVVRAVEQAIFSISRRRDNLKLTLIGYSGGGTIATLLTQLTKLPVETLVTINGNLDIDAWARHHQYTPLVGSLNPINHLGSNTVVSNHHLIGSDDENVVANDWLAVFRNQPNTKIHLHQGFTHNCCWSEIWSDFLNRELK